MNADPWVHFRNRECYFHNMVIESKTNGRNLS